MKIVIDARTLRTSTGRYIERLIHYLQKIDNKNDYVILLKSFVPIKNTLLLSKSALKNNLKVSIQT